MVGKTTDPIAYRVVFDVAEQGYVGWHNALIPVGVLALVYSGAVPLLYHGARRVTLRIYRTVGLLIAAVFQTAGYAIGQETLNEYRALRGALTDNPETMVEGRVENLVAGGPDGHPPERFVVAGHRFEYWPGTHTSAFNKTIGRGGPLRPGVQVRIHYSGHSIARLEIAP